MRLDIIFIGRCPNNLLIWQDCAQGRAKNAVANIHKWKELQLWRQDLELGGNGSFIGFICQSCGHIRKTRHEVSRFGHCHHY